MTGLLLDMRVALRALRRTPAMAVACILCLSLGIGANVAVFSVVHAVLLQRLPFPAPDQLASVWAGYSNRAGIRFFLTPQQFIEIRQRNSVLTTIAASRAETMSLDHGEYPVEVTGARTTASLFKLLNTQLLRGRVFTVDEDRGGVAVAVISEGLWERAYGRRWDVVGSVLQLNGERYEVVGVVPGGAPVPPKTDVWIPLGVDRLEGPDRQAGNLTAIGRLAPNITVADAQTHLAGIADDIAREFPERNTNLTLGISGWQNQLVETARPALSALMAAVGFVLVLAVSNVASLLVVRARSERRQHALRAALGASPLQVFRYLAIENGLLAGAGGILGVLTAALTLPVLLELQPDSLSPFRRIDLNETVLVTSVLVAIGVAAVVTLLVAADLRVAKTGRTRSLAARLGEGGAGSGVSRGAMRLQQALVTGQIALSVVLLVGSSVILRGFREIQRIDAGFDPHGVLAIRVSVPPRDAANHQGRVAYFDALLEAVAAHPGVAAVGAAHVLPVTDIRWGIGFNVEGQPPATRTERHVAVFRMVTPGYHEAMGIRILRGRPFNRADRPASDPVAVISASLAERFWPGEDPIGKRLKRGTYDDPDEPWRTVVGVMTDVRDSAVAAPLSASLHFPLTQWDRSVASRMTLVVRAASDADLATLAPSLEAVVRRVDGTALIAEMAPYADLLGDSIAQERFNTVLLGIFAGIGLVLAAVGIYGVAAYSASQRRHEFGIRLAFGARGRDVRGLMLRAGVVMATAGAFTGIAAAYMVSPLLMFLLPAGSSRDPFSYAAGALILSVTTLLAVWIPARRATAVDPLQVLRGE